MKELEQFVDLQIQFNRNKNLFYKDVSETLRFAESTCKAIRNLPEITAENLALLIDYTTDKALQEFCRLNQYFSFHEEDRLSLKDIYRNLYQDITERKLSVQTLSDTHYENLKNWLQKANLFTQKIYPQQKPTLDTVTCSEYSIALQKQILHLNEIELLEPILDIGCGKAGCLVQNLQENGLAAFGIDRFTDNLPYLDKADWLTFDYGTGKWGTIISHLGFSNHFVHHHLREDGDYIGYATKYMDILKALKIGGYFCYTPDLAFIEKYLDETHFSITKYRVENSPFSATIIQRLK